MNGVEIKWLMSLFVLSRFFYTHSLLWNFFLCLSIFVCAHCFRCLFVSNKNIRSLPISNPFSVRSMNKMHKLSAIKWNFRRQAHKNNEMVLCTFVCVFHFIFFVHLVLVQEPHYAVISFRCCCFLLFSDYSFFKIRECFFLFSVAHDINSIVKAITITTTTSIMCEGFCASEQKTHAVERKIERKKNESWAADEQ